MRLVDRSPRLVSGAFLTIGLLFLIFVYGDGLPEGDFLIDDQSLIGIPLIRDRIDLAWWRTVFTPGSHIDFYPLRDLTYWIDVHLLGASKTLVDETIFRLQNFFWIFCSAWIIRRILIRLKISPVESTIAASVWLIHPLHSETLMWPSARKDALAIFFFTISFLYLIVPSEGPLSTKEKVKGLSAFILGLFSKASATLFPFVLIIKEWRENGIRKGALLFLAVPCLFAGAYLVIQSHLYSSINDMRFFYTPEYRIAGSLAAFGRAFTGIILNRYNAVDVENWGGWVTYNRSFIPIGSAIFLTLGGWTLVEFLKFLKNKTRFAFWGLMLFWATYLPVSGLLFPHRNFYSVRYFEIPFLILFVIGVPIFSRRFSDRTRYFSYGVVALLSIFASFSEGEVWKDSTGPFLKGLRLNPENASLLRMAVDDLDRENSWGHMSSERRLQFEDLKTRLNEACGTKTASDLYRNGHLCYGTWGEELLSRSPGKALLHLPPESREKLIRSIEFVSPKGRSLIEGRLLTLSSGDLPKLNSQVFAGAATPRGRVRGLVIACLENKNIREDLTDLKRKHLLDDASIYELIPELKVNFFNRTDRIDRCFKKDHS